MSMSIWSIRITELRMIIPLRAMIPRIATKPIGVPVGNSAATTPIRPRGATLITRNIFWKLCSCTIRMISISMIISGKTATIELSPLALSSIVPPASIV